MIDPGGSDKVLTNIPDGFEGDITMQTATYTKSLNLIQQLDLPDQMKLIDQLTDLVRQRMTTPPRSQHSGTAGIG